MLTGLIGGAAPLAAAVEHVHPPFLAVIEAGPVFFLRRMRALSLGFAAPHRMQARRIDLASGIGRGRGQARRIPPPERPKGAMRALGQQCGGRARGQTSACHARNYDFVRDGTPVAACRRIDGRRPQFMRTRVLADN